MREKSRRPWDTLARVIVRACAVKRAMREHTSRDDPRVRWMVEQAMVCVAEGMPPREAAALAGDLAFRCYGLPPSENGKEDRPPFEG